MREETHFTEVRELPSGDVVRIDFRFVAKRGKIKDFAINITLLENEKTEDVYRVDTKHKYLHEQRFWVSPKSQKLDYTNYNAAFKDKKEEVLKNYGKWVKWFRIKRGG